MTEGYAEHFVGRRREIQRLLPALREGSLQTALLTGIGGAGKSTLATRLARKLEADGFAPIAISSTAHNPLNAAQLLQVCGDAFLKAGLREAFDTLNNPQIPVDARLRYIVSALNDHRFALVLDNFEVNLDETTRRVINEEIAAFYRHLLANLVGDSRAMVTCRYLPADAPLPRTAREEALGDFPEAQFIKLLLREPELERRYYAGDLPRALLAELHALLGGTPRFLLQIRQSLKTMTTDELRRELEQVNLPQQTKPGELQRLRDEYCQAIFTARLYGYLSAEAQRALSRAAVYGVPVNLEGLAAASGESEDRLGSFTRQWQDYALAYPEREKAGDELWTVYGLLRGWLLAPERLSEDERRVAHKAAGNFLRELEKQASENELGLSWVECLTEAHEQYLAAGEYQDARAVTARISGFLVRSGLYRELIRLNEEMLGYEEHPAPMNLIGRGYVHLAIYPAARSWYERALAKASDEMPEEASTALHSLASIDLNVGDYAAAREKFQTVLSMLQQIGDHAGEAATWHQIASIDVHVGDYAAAREKFQRSLEITQQIGDRAGEAATWHQIATIDVHVGDYAAAREKSQTALQMLQQIGDRAGEATTWHNLATIDLNVGDYAAAREKFQTELQITQQIGDRAGEATTFHQLGFVGWGTGRQSEGARLVALSFLIAQSIGVSEVQTVSQNLAGMAGQLGYTQEQVEEMLNEVAESYQRDRGVALLRAAFGEE
jgi:tetratricopeptide (TPR) repeat protein